VKRAVLLTLAAASAVSARAGAQTLPKVRVVTLPIDLGAEAYYAADMGFFAAGGLDAEVTTLNFGQAIASAIAGGAADIGQSNIVSLATAFERGLDVAIVAPAGYYLAKAPTSMLLVPKTSALRVAKDFSGKTVAVNGLKNITQLSVQLWVDANGGDSTTVKFLELPFAEMGPALDTGRADAALMAEPDATQTIAAGRTRAFVSTFDAIGKSFVIGGWFARRAWIRQNPDTVRRFVAVMAQTAAWANKNQARSAAILEKWTHVHVGNAHRVVYADKLEASEIQPQIDVAARYNVLKSTFPAGNLFAPPEK